MEKWVAGGSAGGLSDQNSRSNACWSWGTTALSWRQSSNVHGCTAT